MFNLPQYSINNRFFLGIALNSGFICVELFYGFRANSLALIADAVHNASDVFGLVLIWFSYYMAQRKAPSKFTYGYKNGTIFAAFFNAIVLFIAVGNLVYESIQRLSLNEHVASTTVIMVASIGVLINGLTALLFMRDRHRDINMLGIYLNMALDAAVSLCVVIGGIFIWWQSWYWIDPLLGLLIAASIVFSFWALFKESINLIFQAVPASINLADIENELSSDPLIISYHDLHVWPLSTTEIALSVHIVTSAENFKPELVHKLVAHFQTKHNIIHPTIQLEVAGQPPLCSYDC